MIAREILSGTAIEVAVILPPGASSHTYDPRPSDLARVRDAGLFLHVAASQDGWSAAFEARDRLELFALLADSEKIPALVDHAHEHSREKPVATGFDPHFWTDPLVVRSLLPVLGAEFVARFPEERVRIEENVRRFSGQLLELDSYASSRLSFPTRPGAVLFHESFRYLFRRYGIDVVDIVEPIPGKEPSARFLKELGDRVRTRRGVVIFSEPQLPSSPARGLGELTGLEVREIDPLGGHGESYRDWFTRNIETLAAAYRKEAVGR